MICQECKAEIRGAPKFCPKCGAKVEAVDRSAPATKVCPQCGAENSLTAKFCKSDGYRFPAEDEVSATGQAVRTPTLAVAASASSTLAEVPAHVPSVDPSSSQGRQASVSVVEALPDAGVLICPQCGTPNAATARFCKKDGAPLHSGNLAPEPPASSRLPPAPVAPGPQLQTGRQRSGRSWKPVLLAGFALLVVAASAGGGLYWFGYIGNRQASAPENVRVKPTREELEQRLTKALADAGMRQVTAQLDEGLTTVTLNDSTLVPEDRAKAEALVVSEVAAAAGIASIKVAHAAAPPPPPTVPPSVASEASSGSPTFDVATAEKRVNDQLRKGGLDGVSARVDANGKATLEGQVATAKDRDRAIRIALAQHGVEGVNDSIRVVATAPPPPPPPVAKREEAPPPPVAARPDPAKLEGEINRALRSGGAGGVTAEVGNDFSVTLKGSATSAAQKERAFQIARQFRNVANLKDRVFVVEQ